MKYRITTVKRGGGPEVIREGDKVSVTMQGTGAHYDAVIHRYGVGLKFNDGQDNRSWYASKGLLRALAASLNELADRAEIPGA